MLNSRAMFAELGRLIGQMGDGSLPAAQALEPWFDYCERVAPECNSLWRDLRQLQFAEDAEQLTAWLQNLLQSDPPPASINALWFGLHNPSLDHDETTCQMYVGGSAAFDPNSDSNEWACDLTWRPAGGYSNSAVLAELYRAIEPLEENDVNYLGEAFLCHGYLAWLVSHWCTGLLQSELLGEAKRRAVAMGHDSGDFYRLAVLQAE